MAISAVKCLNCRKLNVITHSASNWKCIECGSELGIPNQIKPENPRDKLFRLHREMSAKALAVMEAKNADYTNSNASDPLANFRIAVAQGHVKSAAASVFVRLGDKFTRISTLLQNPAKVKSESIYDTIEDAQNYLVLLRFALEEEDHESI